MKTRHAMYRILVATAMAFAIAPTMAQGVAPAAKTDMPPISGNVQLPAGQQNQTGGPMGETGTTLQSGTPAARAQQPVRAVAPAAAPARVVTAAPAPEPAPAPRVRRARADRG